jgi:hypothetical protein
MGAQVALNHLGRLQGEHLNERILAPVPPDRNRLRRHRAFLRRASPTGARRGIPWWTNDHKAAAIFEGAIGRLEPETGNSLLPRHGTRADVEAEIARLAGPLGRSDAMQASASPTQENALLARSAKWEAKHGPAPSPPQSSRRRASCWRRGWRSLRPLCRNRYSSARRL